MIVPEKYSNWLLHRFGIQVDVLKLPHLVADSLDNNRNGIQYADTFNKKEFNCFVGFIDLKGFSSFSSGKNPKEINDFILPFLNKIIIILTKFGCLIDKTIGDEIMFILPHPEEYQYHSAISDLLQIFRLLNLFSFACIVLRVSF